MKILVDTNVLARCVQPHHPQSATAQRALLILLERGETLCLVPQVLYEFWVIATRPIGSPNGLGWTTAEAIDRVGKFSASIPLIDSQSEASVYREWISLVVRYDTRGRAAHDARLVAAMRAASIEAILTFNKSHFDRYVGIVLLTPEDVVTSVP